jgi:transposase InsO family protein
MSPRDDYLKSIYYDPKHPGSYAGPSKLYQAVKAEGKFKIGLTRIKKWLKGQENYTMTHQVRRKFPRNHFVVEGLGTHWQSDLMDMTSLSKYNDGIKYLMVIIDLFSRYLWVLPLTSKHGKHVVDVLTSFWKSESRKPELFQSDSGSEYKNHLMKTFLKSRGIHQIFSLNETKSPYAERVIKTIKMRLYRYMLKNHTYNYTKVLQKVVHSYNHTKHRMLGQTPSSVNETNESEVRLGQYLIKNKSISRKSEKRRKFTFKLDETVRVSHLRQTFDREYQEKWSGEIFTITKRYWSQGRDLYKLKDWGGDPIDGTFYSTELQSVTENPHQEYRIQDIIKKRTSQKKKEVLVKWLHWPKKYNSWIPEEDVRQYGEV